MSHRSSTVTGMGHLDVNPGQLLAAAAGYDELSARIALLSPQATTEVQRIADSHGLIGYPTALGIAAGLADAEQPVMTKAADFQTYSQNLTEHAATYTDQDQRGADALKAAGNSTDTAIRDLKSPKDSAGQRDGKIEALGHDIPLDPPPKDPGYSAHPTWRYTADDLYTHEPTAGDIHQDGIGDCYLDATIGAIANANPQWIRDRIKFDDETGQFDVTLWDGHTWQHVSVTQDDVTTDISHHGASWRDNGQPKAALWPSVLESAYAKFHSPEQSFPHALDSGITGGQGRDAMQALTGNQGHNIDPQKVWWTDQHLDQDITQGLANHQPITIATGNNGGPLVSNHVYIVEGITGTGSDAQVIMRNPWESNPRDPNNPLITVRLGDLIGSGLTGKLEKLGTHPVYDINIGSLG
jgi:hypothetical protein